MENEFETIEGIVIKSLMLAFETHELLGRDGEELVQKNQYGETALKVLISFTNSGDNKNAQNKNSHVAC